MRAQLLRQNGPGGASGAAGRTPEGESESDDPKEEESATSDDGDEKESESSAEEEKEEENGASHAEMAARLHALRGGDDGGRLH